MRSYFLFLCICLCWSCQDTSVFSYTRHSFPTGFLTPDVGFPLKTDSCYRICLKEGDTIPAWATEQGQLVAVIDYSYEEKGTYWNKQGGWPSAFRFTHCIPLYFTPIAHQQVQYIGVGSIFPNLPTFEAADYTIALNSPNTDFPHQRFVFTLLAQALQGDTTAHRLFLQYPTDFQEVLNRLDLEPFYQHWKDRLELLAPITTASIPRPSSVWTIRSTGDLNRLYFEPPFDSYPTWDSLEHAGHFVYQDDQCITMAYPSEQGFMAVFDLPIYEKIDDHLIKHQVPFQLFLKSYGDTYSRSTTQVSSARLIRDCSMLESNYLRLYQEELSLKQYHTRPSAEHQLALQLFLSELLITTMQQPYCALFKSFSSDFAHSIRYYTPLYQYLNQIAPLLLLNNSSTALHPVPIPN